MNIHLNDFSSADNFPYKKYSNDNDQREGSFKTKFYRTQGLEQIKVILDISLSSNLAYF